MNEEAILNDINFRLLLLVFCRQFKDDAPKLYDLVVKDIRDEYVSFLTGDATELPREKAKMFGVDYGENTNAMMTNFDKLASIVRNNITNILEGFQGGNWHDS